MLDERQYMIRHKSVRIEKSFSVQYDKANFDFGIDDFDEDYPNLESYNLALESARNESNYLQIAKLLVFQIDLGDYGVDYLVTEYEEWSPIFQEAIYCYDKANLPIYAAEVMIEYAKYKDINIPKEKQEFRDLVSKALSICERENHKDGIFEIARAMRNGGLDNELENLEIKHEVQFGDVLWGDHFTWGFILSKFALVIIAMSFPILPDYGGWYITGVIMSFFSLLGIDFLLMKKKSEEFMIPWDRFFQWLEG